MLGDSPRALHGSRHLGKHVAERELLQAAQSEVIRGHLMLEECIASQSEVIRAIAFGPWSMIAGSPHLHQPAEDLQRDRTSVSLQLQQGFSIGIAGVRP